MPDLLRLRFARNVQAQLVRSKAMQQSGLRLTRDFRRVTLTKNWDCGTHAALLRDLHGWMAALAGTVSEASREKAWLKEIGAWPVEDPSLDYPACGAPL